MHARATLPALRSLTEHGYVGRVEAAEFGEDYRVLRLVEHRLQLRRLQRTHLLPTDEGELRVIARASGLAPDGPALSERIARVRGRVRGLHQRLFYRPLLTAVSNLPEDELMLTPEAALDRLASIGFLDPRGALLHIAALTAGSVRRASIQRTLLPVLLQWFGRGRRRISDCWRSAACRSASATPRGTCGCCGTRRPVRDGSPRCCPSPGS